MAQSKTQARRSKCLTKRKSRQRLKRRSRSRRSMRMRGGGGPGHPPAGHSPNPSPYYYEKHAEENVQTDNKNNKNIFAKRLLSALHALLVAAPVAGVSYFLYESLEKKAFDALQRLEALQDRYDRAFRNNESDRSRLEDQVRRFERVADEQTRMIQHLLRQLRMEEQTREIQRLENQLRNIPDNSNPQGQDFPG